MPDVDERLDRVEQGLKDLGERIDGRFTQVDERFAQVDKRFAQVDERFAQVDRRFTGLQVLVEDCASQIKLIAEVQTHHGSVLEEIKEAIEPLKGLRPLFEQVARDHEKRITALEGNPPSRTDARFRE
jgi:archaellum component FlaC